MIAVLGVVAVNRADCFTVHKNLFQTPKKHTYKTLTNKSISINIEKFTINYTKDNLLAEFLTE
jgi:hypothetical protein